MTGPDCLAEALGPGRYARLQAVAAQSELKVEHLLVMIVEGWLSTNAHGQVSQPLLPAQPALFSNTSLPAPPATKKIRRSVQQGLLPAATAVEKAELDWRVDRVWEAHVEAWSRFWVQENGVPTRAPRQPSAEVRAAIVTAIRRFDSHLLDPDLRADFLVESQARAAGIGIFYDQWMTGHHKDNDVNAGGRRYLGHDRPWVPQRDKMHPVERYGALYFEKKAIFDEQDRRANGGGGAALHASSGGGLRSSQRVFVPAAEGLLGDGGLASPPMDQAAPPNGVEVPLQEKPWPAEREGFGGGLGAVLSR